MAMLNNQMAYVLNIPQTWILSLEGPFLRSFVEAKTCVAPGVDVVWISLTVHVDTHHFDLWG